MVEEEAGLVAVRKSGGEIEILIAAAVCVCSTKVQNNRQWAPLGDVGII